MLPNYQPQLPPPARWSDFEDLCWWLFRELWKDPDTLKHGRSGQAQQGVDVFGRPEGGAELAGVQCKGKDLYTHQRLTEAELIAEVEKAKRFDPPLSRFILATTAPRDAHLQRVARHLTDAHQQRGLFSVAVWSWEELVAELMRQPSTYARFYGSREQVHARDPSYLSGSRLRRLRRELQLSPSRFAELLDGLGEPEYRRFEAPAAACPQSLLETAAARTGASLDWLKHGTGQPFAPPDSWDEPVTVDDFDVLAALGAKRFYFCRQRWIGHVALVAEVDEHHWRFLGQLFTLDLNGLPPGDRDLAGIYRYLQSFFVRFHEGAAVDIRGSSLSLFDYARLTAGRAHPKRLLEGSWRRSRDERYWPDDLRDLYHCYPIAKNYGTQYGRWFLDAQAMLRTAVPPEDTPSPRRVPGSASDVPFGLS